MRIIKASRTQRLDYPGENNLFGFVHISHTDCAIETIGRGEDLRYRLRAPATQCFIPAHARSISFDSIEKLQEHLKATEIRLVLASAA